VKILYFIDSELQQKAQLNLLPEDISRESYLHFLEVDYSRRMVEQHKDEMGLFGRVGPTISLDPLQIETQHSLDQYLSN
jgi:hypothetical protein